VIGHTNRPFAASSGDLHTKYDDFADIFYSESKNPVQIQERTCSRVWKGSRHMKSGTDILKEIEISGVKI
jgi:hypothetical protein